MDSCMYSNIYMRNSDSENNDHTQEMNVCSKGICAQITKPNEKERQQRISKCLHEIA